MIIGTEVLDRHVRCTLSMDGIVETTRGTVRIICRNKATIVAGEDDVENPKPPSEQHR